jgi:hypothetical protein
MMVDFKKFILGIKVMQEEGSVRNGGDYSD